ncbi:FkbM family methyltransferase [Burkholderia cenocepacia]|uniref:FkbM family methyltransferase n=1 Tax=Burkholderia cenocepacia TaxID=95486 RepID=UPI00098255D9|nr:FkbM family methyltransferase [Burkholderia cenocepacia]ONO43739.1 hypothetical protein A8D72_34890 [Burkholderia cenocepacia]
MSITTYAQNFEDILLWRSLGHIPSGQYIDVGAHHPSQDSVSQLFYEHGWRGVHVEPTLECANLLRIARPDETVVQALVAEHSGMSAFHEILGTGLSTARKDIADEHHEKHGYSVRTSLVPSVTLDTLLDLAPNDDIHWLKIDVEGFELEVLSGWKKSQRRPWIIVIEATYPNTQIDTSEAWQEIVLKKGYVLVYKDGLNHFYVSNAHPELKRYFTFPPNIFDDFQIGDNAHWLTRSIKQTHNQQLAQAAEEKEIIERQLQETATAIGQLQTEMLARERDFDERIADYRADAQRQADAHRDLLLEIERSHKIELVEAGEQRHAAEQQLAAAQFDALRMRSIAEAREHALTTAIKDISSESQKIKTALVEVTHEHDRRHAETIRTIVEQKSAFEQKLDAATDLISSMQIDAEHQRNLFTELVRITRHNAQLSEHSHATKLLESENTRAKQLQAAIREFELREARLREHQAAELERINTEHRALEDAIQAQHLSRENEYQHKLTEHISSLRQEQEQQKNSFEAQIAALRQDNDVALTIHQKIHEELERYRQYAHDLALELDALNASWYGRLAWRAHPLTRVRSMVQAISRLVISRPANLTTHTTPDQGIGTWSNNFHSLDAAAGSAIRETEATRLSPQYTRSKMKLSELLALPDEEFVRAAFITALRREPDSSGFHFYLNRLGSGYTKIHILADIFRSKEAKAHLNHTELATLPDEAFVDTIYRRVLGRPADPDGKQYFVEVLKRSGNREHVVNEIKTSSEAMNIDASNAEFERELLDRLKNERRDRWWWNRGARLEKKIDKLEHHFDKFLNLERRINGLADHIERLSTGLATIQLRTQPMDAMNETLIESRSLIQTPEFGKEQKNSCRPTTRALDAEVGKNLPIRAQLIFQKLKKQRA